MACCCKRAVTGFRDDSASAGTVYAGKLQKNGDVSVFSGFSAMPLLHDRMLQAAYLSMSEELRQQTHLRVGRLLLLQYKNIDALSDEECFAIVEQLNNARALICERR